METPIRADHSPKLTVDKKTVSLFRSKDCYLVPPHCALPAGASDDVKQTRIPVDIAQEVIAKYAAKGGTKNEDLVISTGMIISEGSSFVDYIATGTRFELPPKSYKIVAGSPGNETGPSFQAELVSLDAQGGALGVPDATYPETTYTITLERSSDNPKSPAFFKYELADSNPFSALRTSYKLKQNLTPDDTTPNIEELYCDYDGHFKASAPSVAGIPQETYEFNFGLEFEKFASGSLTSDDIPLFNIHPVPIITSPIGDVDTIEEITVQGQVTSFTGSLSRNDVRVNGKPVESLTANSQNPDSNEPWRAAFTHTLDFLGEGDQPLFESITVSTRDSLGNVGLCMMELKIKLKKKEGTIDKVEAKKAKVFPKDKNLTDDDTVTLFESWSRVRNYSFRVLGSPGIYGTLIDAESVTIESDISSKSYEFDMGFFTDWLRMIPKMPEGEESSDCQIEAILGGFVEAQIQDVKDISFPTGVLFATVPDEDPLLLMAAGDKEEPMDETTYFAMVGAPGIDENGQLRNELEVKITSRNIDWKKIKKPKGKGKKGVTYPETDQDVVLTRQSNDPQDPEFNLYTIEKKVLCDTESFPEEKTAADYPDLLLQCVIDKDQQIAAGVEIANDTWGRNVENVVKIDIDTTIPDKKEGIKPYNIFLNEDFDEARSASQLEGHKECMEIDHSDNDCSSDDGNEIGKVDFEVQPTNIEGTVRFEKSGEGDVKLYNNDKETKLTFGKEYALPGEIPYKTTLYVKGTNKGQLTLTSVLKVANYECKDKILINVVKLDVDHVKMEPKPDDQHEICDMRLVVRLNDDDDNENGKPDKDEKKGPVDKEDGLFEIVIRAPEPGIDGKTEVEIKHSENLKLYEDKEKKKKASEKYKVSELPKSLWVEGDKVSKKALDAFVKVSIKALPDKGTYAEDEIRFTVVKVDLDVDSDNNGEIEDADDSVEDSKEFLFWLNNNNDGGTVDTKDKDDLYINLEMDLQDLAPFMVTLSKDSLPSGAGVFLEMENGLAIIRVFEHAGEAKKHLNDSSVASAMRFTPNYDNPQQNGLVGDGSRLELDLDDFENDIPKWFVLEGNTAGLGKLCLVVRSADGTEIGRDEVLLNLHDIDDLWSELNMRGCSGNNPTSGAASFSAWFNDLETDDITWEISDGKWGRANNAVLIFVHGYSVTESGGRVWNRDVFKRLYWFGYRGNFVGLLWRGDQDIVALNPNIFNSFQTGSALAQILPWIKDVHEDRKLCFMTHSLGNNVASEAIRKAAPGLVTTYMMSQAATGAGAYLSNPNPVASHDIAPWDALNPKLLAQAQSFGYKDPPLSYDEIWEQRWAAYPSLHPGGANPWWSGLPAQPSFVDYQERWRDCDNNPDPQRSYFASVTENLTGKLYCLYSPLDDVLGDTSSFNAWMDNQLGFWPLLVPPQRPAWAYDDESPETDCFGDSLPEQIDVAATPDVITAERRKWALLSYYFCDLTMAAGAIGIGDGEKYQSKNTQWVGLGINEHSAMRDRPLHNVREFWKWVADYIKLETE